MLTTVAAAALLAAAIATAAAGSGGEHGVGLVLDGPISRTPDAFRSSAFRGLVRAQRSLHVQAKAVASSPTGSNDLAPYDYLARRHYDLVISLPFITGLSQAARRFPHATFVVLDGTRQALDHPVARNVEGTVFHTEEAAYLAGFAAAKVADRGPAPHVVSAVGGFPGQPQVEAYIAGFQAGAKRADPRIKVLTAYSHDYINQDTCRHIALLQIAHDSRVVFDVAGDCGLGALEAAKQKGVSGVGVDTDQSNLGDFILTSVVINLNRAVYDLATRLVHDRLPTGGNLSYDLRDHGVYLGRFSKHVSRSLRRQLKALARQIVSGKIVVPATVSSHR